LFRKVVFICNGCFSSPFNGLSKYLYLNVLTTDSPNEGIAFYLDFRLNSDSQLAINEGYPNYASEDPDVTFTLDSFTLHDILSRKVRILEAFSEERIIFSGNEEKLLKLYSLRNKLLNAIGDISSKRGICK